MKKNYKKALIFAVKCLVAAALLAWVLNKVHLHDYSYQSPEGQIHVKGLITIAKGINWWFLACGTLGFVLSLLVVAVRWWMLLRIQRIRIALWESVRLTFLGQFFNAVVPGVVGGDLVKAYYVSKHTPKKAAVLLSVFVDRVLGPTELTIMAGAMIVVTVVVVLILALLLRQRLRSGLKLQKIYQRLPMADHIAAAGDAAVLYRKRIRVLLKAILITLGAHILWVGAIAMLGVSLSLHVPWHSYFLYIPLIYIIASVPLTPGGIGIAENFYLIFFVPLVAGSAESQVFALAVLARIIPMLWGLPGAVVAVTGPKLPKAEAIQAELGLSRADSE
ncbi:MAG: lysylphosphatidylglycerol synthase transmembrane domain-containing protein [Planctomycetota bacterium]